MIDVTERDHVQTDVIRTLRTDRHRRHSRWLAVSAGAAVAVLGLLVAALTMGSVRISLRQAALSLAGVMDNQAVNFVVKEVQWPPAQAGLATGLALGVAGTLFQQLLRNPLASPDFVGISSGASLAAVAAIALPGLSGAAIPALALAGALISAVLMYLLAWRDGVAGYRFVLIGIGVSAFMYGVIGYLLARADLTDAREAMHWLTGSVGQSLGPEVTALWVALAVLVPLSIVVRRQLRVLQLGDDTGVTLGTRVEWARALLLLIAVILTGLATAVCGPLVFVALTAGPVADRLLGRAAGGLLPAALVGAGLVLAADYVATYLLPTPLPTGVVTGAVGAPYLLWLLATSNREGSSS